MHLILNSDLPTMTHWPRGSTSESYIASDNLHKLQLFELHCASLPHLSTWQNAHSGNQWFLPEVLHSYYLCFNFLIAKLSCNYDCISLPLKTSHLHKPQAWIIGVKSICRCHFPFILNWCFPGFLSHWNWVEYLFLIFGKEYMTKRKV